ncbi:hypothetical protein [Parasitella parasitica]|uniref:Reverse transcriptase domain-containing protein n=1 Tax=Parasitella parasitica TaxID=35722 RepID=A0A0B7ND82_9FUNG|nr:hypothetical protein [Parasitella parasitica]
MDFVPHSTSYHRKSNSHHSILSRAISSDRSSKSRPITKIDNRESISSQVKNLPGLSDAILYIGYHQESRRFLRLKLKDQVYQYCTTAFEYFCPPGFEISAYLDDWILASSSKELAMQQAQTVVALLRKLGCIANLKKSVLNPTQRLENFVFCIEYTHNDSDSTIGKASQHTAINHADTKQTFLPDSMRHPQPYHEGQGSKNRSVSGNTVHATRFALQEPGEWGCSQGKQRTNGYWTQEEASQSISCRKLKAAHLALETIPR